MQERGAPISSNTATVFPDLRAAAAELLKAHPEVVRVDEVAIDRLANTLSAQEVSSKAERVGLPLKFGNALEELNFHAVLALLGFGAAYEGGHPHLAESARDTVLFGLIGLHLTKADLHAGFLLTASCGDVAGYFGIDPMESVPHESVPAIRIERPGPLSGYVDTLVATMNTTGQRLKELAEPDMARFVLSALKSQGDQPMAARLVSALAAAFPTTFGEALQGGFVPHKKALVLAGECYHRLRHALPALAFADFATAPGFVTPAIITHLVKLGVLAPPEGAAEGQGGDEEAARALMLGKPGNVAVLAAAAVLALDAIAAKWEGVAPLDIAYFLDEVYGKEQGQEGQREQQGQGAGRVMKFVPPREQTIM